MTNKRIHLIYSIVLSILLAVAGVCLITACLGIYLSGDRAFTRESVAAAFSGIAVPVYLCLALVFGGFILDGFFPAETKKQPPEKQYHAILKQLYSKMDTSSPDPAIRMQQKARKTHKFISLLLLVAGSIVFLSYGANSANFDQQDITGSMIRSMYWFIPCLAIPFAYGVFTAYFEKASLKKEIELVKQAIANGAQTAQTVKKQPADHTKLLLGIRLALLGLAVAILVYGFFTGGTNDVLTKAINICTECVGLG